MQQFDSIVISRLVPTSSPVRSNKAAPSGAAGILDAVLRGKGNDEEATIIYSLTWLTQLVLSWFLSKRKDQGRYIISICRDGTPFPALLI